MISKGACIVARTAVRRGRASIGCCARRQLATTWACADAQLEALGEVKEAAALDAAGQQGRAIPLLQRTVEICEGAMGTQALLTQAANRRLGLTLYRAGRLAEAEAAVRAALAVGGSVPLSEYVGTVLLLSRTQLFQGKLQAAADTCEDAIKACEDPSHTTPDTEALGHALQSMGVVQLLRGEEDGAETSLLRAARLGNSAIDQAKALSSLAAYSVSLETEEGHREAMEYWKEALDVLVVQDVEAGAQVPQEQAALRETRALTLASLAEAQLKGPPEPEAPTATSARKGPAVAVTDTKKPLAHLSEALKLCEGALAADDPYLGWVLAQTARCYHLAGQAVTAEGLFRSALEKLDPEDVHGRKALMMHPSPVNQFLLVGALSLHAELLLQWERREAAGEALHARAKALEAALPLKLPPRVSLPMLHLCR